MLKKFLALPLLFIPSLAFAEGGVFLYDPTTNTAYNSSNPLPVSATASLSGFTPSASGARMTPITVATSDTSGTLPTGSVVVVSNVGTTNPMYCNVNGVAATMSDQLIGANSWFAFTIPTSITTLHCIATGGSTTANGVGGTGLPTGAGGGGGGSGGAITMASGAVSSGAYTSGSLAAGSSVDWGNITSISQYSGSGQPSSGFGLLWDMDVQIRSPMPAATTNRQVVGALQLCDQSTLTTTSSNCATVSSNGLLVNQGANASGTPWYVQPGSGATFQVQSNSANLATDAHLTAIQVANGGASAATNANQVAGVYNSSPLSLSNGQGAAFQLSPTGLLGNQPVGSAAFAVTVSSSVATTGSTATTLVSARTGSPGTGRQAVTITNTGSQTIYIGAANTVTSTTGHPLPAGAAFTLNVTAAVYGVIASGSGSASAIETY